MVRTPSDPTPRESFAQRFCHQFGVNPEHFSREVLRRTLYPHARWACLLGSEHLLALDRSFVENVGQLTRRRDFIGEAAEFQNDPRNRKFWRRRARFRVSIGRMQSLFDSVFGGRA